MGFFECLGINEADYLRRCTIPEDYTSNVLEVKGFTEDYLRISFWGNLLLANYSSICVICELYTHMQTHN